MKEVWKEFNQYPSLVGSYICEEGKECIHDTLNPGCVS